MRGGTEQFPAAATRIRSFLAAVLFLVLEDSALRSIPTETECCDPLSEYRAVTFLYGRNLSHGHRLYFDTARSKGSISFCFSRQSIADDCGAIGSVCVSEPYR